MKRKNNNKASTKSSTFADSASVAAYAQATIVDRKIIARVQLKCSHYANWIPQQEGCTRMFLQECLQDTAILEYF